MTRIDSAYYIDSLEEIAIVLKVFTPNQLRKVFIQKHKPLPIKYRKKLIEDFLLYAQIAGVIKLVNGKYRLGDYADHKFAKFVDQKQIAQESEE